MDNKIWSVLLHLSTNMWSELGNNKLQGYCDKMRFDKHVWDQATEYAAECGFNTVVIDLGDAVKYRSHPEIALSDAWEIPVLKSELARLRKMGLNPVPKLNFSSNHDLWMGKYSRMVSTDIYYQVCRDLIEEVIEIFDTPDYFHLGMDEERGCEEDFYPQHYEFVCYRRGNLLWHDVNFLCGCVSAKGVRPWIFADLYWLYPEEFVKRVDKNVLISPWIYSRFDSPFFNATQQQIDAFKEMSELGYQQVPAGSNYIYKENMRDLIRFSAERISPETLAGFMMTGWMPTVEERKFTIYEGIQLTKLAREACQSLL